MCGIAGIFSSSWNDSQSAALLSMQSALSHRGPDDCGIWTNPPSGAGLAHTRLAILDLSPAGHQPMLSSDERYIITFNGEIYNFRELRSECEAKGLIFRTHTDTEVLLHLYATQGASMVTRLRGMFAFCIWDQHERTAFLARDPLGIKPLYYSNLNGELAFASELRALRRSGLISQEKNPAAILDFLMTGSVPEPATLLRDVNLLEAGHTLTWKSGQTRLASFWHLKLGNGSPHADPVALTRQSLLDSIRAHFVSDVPVGLFLSGGLDSTALLALACTSGHPKPDTFSISVEDARLNEGNVAQQTARHFGTHHHNFHLSDKTGETLFIDYLDKIDQPSIDGFNSFVVSRFASDAGTKVALSGVGGDELFGGYPSFTEVPKLTRLLQLGRCIPGIGKAIEYGSPKPQWRRVGDVLRQPVTITSVWQAKRGIFTHREASILTQHFNSQKIQDNPSESLPSPASDLIPKDEVSSLEFKKYMRNQLLRDSDVMSMACGLELRLPFVDSHLVDTIGHLPASQRLQSGKQLLVDAVPEIPSWVRNQPKRGFVFPFEKWLGGSMNESFSSATNSIPFSNPTWYQRWAVFMLDHWLAKTA
jgi:asparagine synthase (glutamine-hydrolysing)